MDSYPELGSSRLILWRLIGEADNELCCDVKADGDRLILTVREAGTGNLTREVHPDIEPLVGRSDEIHEQCVDAGWRPPGEFDEELSS